MSAIEKVMTAAPFTQDNTNEQADIIVLDAGIVGVSVALHLQTRGCKVILLTIHQFCRDRLTT